ncbi:MAG: hypothetical protein HWN80_13010 [Candidatus Lokiarchaeota archaeon]|nr:hypothetical protein [Candidatus Lokiarchaeota archaeon]
MKFPEITGENLEKKKYTIPYDLEGELNVVIVPFQRWHQSLVDEWSVFLNSIEQRDLNFRYYEVPTLNSAYKAMRFMIDGGMRAGIPERGVRERTITLYTNKPLFEKQLSITSEDTIYLFLIRKNGEILWRSEGEFDAQKGDDLLETIEKLNV